MTFEIPRTCIYEGVNYTYAERLANVSRSLSALTRRLEMVTAGYHAQARDMAKTRAS